MQSRGEVAPSAQDERAQRLKVFVRLVYLGFQSFDLCGLNAKTAIGVILARPCDICAKIEQVVLYPRQNSVGVSFVGKASDHPNRSICLVDIPLRANTEGMFHNARSVAQRCFAAIAAAGVNLVEFYHSVLSSGLMFQDHRVSADFAAGKTIEESEAEQ
jgi:hypothetical protein